MLPLDAAPAGGRPVGAYPLMRGVPTSSASSQAGEAGEVKGTIRDGGLVVARKGDQVLWPRRRLRA